MIEDLDEYTYFVIEKRKVEPRFLKIKGEEHEISPMEAIFDATVNKPENAKAVAMVFLSLNEHQGAWIFGAKEVVDLLVK